MSAGSVNDSPAPMLACCISDLEAECLGAVGHLALRKGASETMPFFFPFFFFMVITVITTLNTHKMKRSWILCV